MARFVIRDIEPLEIELSNGDVLKAMFNNEAFIIFTEEFGDINKVMKTEADSEPFEFGAKLLYSGLKVTRPQIQLDEVRVITVKGGWGLLMSIFGLMMDNFSNTSNEETKKKFLKEMEPEIEALPVEFQQIFKKMLK